MATVLMKFVLIVALLVYAKCNSTSGKKNVCATPGNPININVHGTQGVKGEKGEKGDSGTSCKCNLQDPNKPSAHIEAAKRGNMDYQLNEEIKDWSISAPHSHLEGGMKYHDGKLTVPTPGRYYIYAQLYYHSSARVNVRVNNNVVTMIQPPASGKTHGALYAGGVFKLKAGDVISLIVHTAKFSSSFKVYMGSFHSYFGAFLI